MDPLSVLEERYGCEEMRSIFRANTYLRRLLEVEATLAEVQSELDIIPKEHGKLIRNGIENVERKRVEEIESEIKHDVMAVVKALAEQVGEAGKSIHFGATSYDIVDTARGLQHKEALAIIWALDELRPYLIGKHFTLETDCKNLQWLMKAEKPQRLVRWAM